MVNAFIYVEGGGDSKDLRIRCQEGFTKLLERAGFAGRLPRIVPCGGRAQTYDRFCTALRYSAGKFVAILLDSEEPLDDLNETWKHLQRRDQWPKPPTAANEQVLFMTTCMETWIVTDRQTLRRYYGSNLHENGLPPLTDLESRSRKIVQEQLEHATRACKNRYLKGKRSFAVLAALDPNALAQHLPSFERCRRILQAKL